MPVRGLRRIARTCLLPFAITAATTVAACHEAGDVRVMSLSFKGTHAFSQGQLRNVLATQKSGWLPWSVKRYFDRQEFENDLKRIVAFYADRGFPDARITGVDVAFNQAKDGVKLTINVDTANHVVTLKGSVKSAAGKARAVALARNTDGVTKVVDQLVIK